jgi:hypothetical protein
MKIMYFLTFNKFSPKVYKVFLFDCSCAKVVEKCPKHPKVLEMIVDEELVLCASALVGSNAVLSK